MGKKHNLKRKILVVEDEEFLLELLTTVLNENGYGVYKAIDGEEAYAMYVQHQDEIALVLSDLGLPKLGGWEAFSKMREVNPEIKAILASGYFDPMLQKRILAAGASKFVQKPYNMPEILKMIKQLIGD